MSKTDFEAARKRKSIAKDKLTDVCPDCDKWRGPGHECKPADTKTEEGRQYCLIPRGMDDYSFRFCNAIGPPKECRDCQHWLYKPADAEMEQDSEILNLKHRYDEQAKQIEEEKASEIQAYGVRVAELLQECRDGHITNADGSNAMIALLVEARDIIDHQAKQIEAKDTVLNYILDHISDTNNAGKVFAGVTVEQLVKKVTQGLKGVKSFESIPKED